MHLCSDAQKPRSVKTAPAVLTYRTSCINATDSKCRRAIKPKAQNLSTLSANARGDDILNRSQLCVWQCHLRNVSTLSNRTPPIATLPPASRAHENRGSCPRESRLMPTRHRARRQAPFHHSTRQNRNEFFYSRDLAQADHSLRALRTN